MTVTNYSMTLVGGLLKTNYIGPIREQLNNSTVLKKKIIRNTEDIAGGEATLGRHTGRNLSVAARVPGHALPIAGQQTHGQMTTALKYVYGRGRLTGPDINKTKNNKGAFAKLIDTEVQGLTKDMDQQVNRMLFGDGSGFLALNSVTDTTSPNVIAPYLWYPAAKYIKNLTGLRMQMMLLDGTLDPAWDDADNGLVNSTTTDTGLAWSAGTAATATAGAGVGIWGGVQVGASNAMTRKELMGLWGIVHDTNLIGDQNYAYDLANSITNFLNPEIVAISATGWDLTIASMVNRLQGIDANADSTWRAHCKGGSGVPRVLTLEMMRDLWSELTVTEGSDVDLIIGPYQQQNAYAALMEEKRRIVNTMKLDGGFTGIEYNGVPFVADKDAPRGTIFMVDTSSLQMYVSEDYNWIEDGGGSPLHYISGFDAFDMVLRYYAELGCLKRSANGKLFDLIEE